MAAIRELRRGRALVLVLAVVLACLGLVACGGGDDGDDGPAGTTTTAPAAGEDGTSRPGGGYDRAEREQEEPAPAVPTIVTRDGAPVGGPAELEFDAGERVRFRVRSNVAEEVHVHGYDETAAVPAGGTATLAFPADIEGIFEVELHGSGELIAKLQVNP